MGSLLFQGFHKISLKHILLESSSMICGSIIEVYQVEPEFQLHPDGKKLLTSFFQIYN